jgi:hypothetical protein
MPDNLSSVLLEIAARAVKTRRACVFNSLPCIYRYLRR